MKTLRSFTEEDEMDYTEAAEAAITKRKYLLNRLFEYEEVLKECMNRPLSLSGHVDSQENKKLRFCPASVGQTTIQCEACRAKKQSFLFS